MLEKNLSAIRSRSPELAHELQDHKSQDIAVLKTLSDDVNISYKGIPLHSNIDPIAEAYDLYRDLKVDNNFSVVILFGVGLGYLLKRLYMEFPGHIIIYEPNKDVLRFTVENVDFADIYEDKRVTVCKTQEDVIQRFNEIYLRGDLFGFTYLPSYQHTNLNELTEILAAFEKILVEMAAVKTGDKTVIKTLQNVCNFKFYKECLPVESLEYKFAGSTATIVGSGPSLDEHIKYLQELQGKTVILSVLSAVQPLLMNGIKPDLVVVNDVADTKTYLKDVDTSCLNFLLSSYSDGEIFSYPAKSKFIYFEQDDSLAHAFPKVQKWYTSASASIMAYFSAMKMGFKNIILVGNDLCCYPENFYTHQAIHADWHVSRQSETQMTIVNRENAVIFTPAEIKKVQNVAGENCITTIHFLRLARYFEAINRKFSEDVQVFALGHTSLKLDGVNNSSFEGIMQTISFADSDKDLFEKLFESLKLDFNGYYKNFVMFYSKCFKESVDLESKLNFAMNFGSKILEEYHTSHNTDIAHYQDYTNYQTEMAFIRQFLTENPLYISGTKQLTLQYINQYITPEKAGTDVLGIEDIMTNVAFELTYIKQLMVFVSQVLSILKTEIKINAIEVAL